MNNDITLQEGVDFLRDAGKKLFTMGFDEDKPEKPRDRNLQGQGRLRKRHQLMQMPQ
jgi:hypothetical protein